MTSRRNQLLKKLISAATTEDEKKLYQLTIEWICADMCEFYYKFYHNDGPGVIVYAPEQKDEEKSMFYLPIDNLKIAIDDLNKAFRLDPNSVFAYFNRGLSYFKLGDYQRAIEDLNKAIRLDPNFAIAYNNRGFSYDKLGNYKKAIENYKEAIRLDPNYATAKQNLESILRRR